MNLRTRRSRRTATPLLRSALGGNSDAPRTLQLACRAAVGELGSSGARRPSPSSRFGLGWPAGPGDVGPEQARSCGRRPGSGPAQTRLSPERATYRRARGSRQPNRGRVDAPSERPLPPLQGWIDVGTGDPGRRPSPSRGLPWATIVRPYGAEGTGPGAPPNFPKWTRRFAHAAPGWRSVQG